MSLLALSKARLTTTHHSSIAFPVCLFQRLLTISFLATIAVLTSSSMAFAQLPTATLTAISPLGGKQGSTFDVTVSGSNLEEGSKLHFSHPGITAVPKMGEKSEYQDAPEPLPNQFIVTIKPDVPPGVYEAHFVGYFGISNPRAFQVSSLKEVAEANGNNSRESAMEVELNSIVTGKADDRRYDYFKLNLKQGEKVVVDCWAHRLDSKMDGVLTLFDGNGNELDRCNEANYHDPLLAFTATHDGPHIIQVNDFFYAGGNEHGYRLKISTAPYIDFILPAAGQPGTNGKFTIYGYNLPGGQPASEMQKDGQTLEKVVVDISIPGKDQATKLQAGTLIPPASSSLDGFEYRLPSPQGPSNPIVIGYSEHPVVLETEPNNDATKMQTVSLPCEVNGQFNPRGDKDYFVFEAKKDEVYWLEILSQRMGLVTDPYMLVQQINVDKEGKETYKDIKELDDTDPKTSNIGGSKYDTSTDDPAYLFKAPDDGKYRVLIKDLYSGSRGNPAYIYRLAIRPEHPDFRLVALPVFASTNNNQTGTSTPFLRKGGTESIEVFAFRRDDFKGDIELSVEGLPSGVTAAPAFIGSENNSTELILTAADNAAAWVGEIKIFGKSKIGDQETTRQARGGSIVWPAVNNQSATQSRMAQTIVLGVSNAESSPYFVEIGENKILETSRGGTIELPVKVTRRGKFDDKIALAAVGLPKTITAKNINIDKGKNDGKLEIALTAQSPVGTYTFYMQSSGSVPYEQRPEATKKAEEYSKKIAQMAADLDKASKAAAQVVAEKTKQVQDATNELKAAEAKAKAAKDDAKPEAENELKAAQEKLNQANTAKAEAEQAAKEAADKAKRADDEKKKAEADFKSLANSSKEKKINLASPSTPITLKIVEAPIQVELNPPGNLKQGEKIELPVKITKQYGFDDEVSLSIATPKGSSGLKIDNVKIAKGQQEGKFTIEAAKNAKAGSFPFELKLTLKFNNQALTVTKESTINIEAVEEPKK